MITVSTDDEWQRLCQALGEPDWAMQTKFATQDGRLQYEAELDRCLSDWTQTQDARAAMAHLQAHGIAAGMVLFEPDAYDDPQLNARGFFETMTHPQCGTHRYPGRMWKMSKTPATFRSPPCCLGEHNAYVYGELLGLSEEEIERLRQAGHIGDTYADA